MTTWLAGQLSINRDVADDLRARSGVAPSLQRLVQPVPDGENWILCLKLKYLFTISPRDRPIDSCRY